MMCNKRAVVVMSNNYTGDSNSMNLVCKRDDGSMYDVDLQRATRKEIIKWIADNNKRPEGILAAVWQAWGKEDLVEYVRTDRIPATSTATLPAPTVSTSDTPSIDRAVRDLIAATHVKSNLDEERVLALIEQHSRKTVTIEIKTPTITARTEAKQHRMFPLVAAMIAARANVYLHGTFGTGKTRMAEEICKLLGVDYHIVPFSPQESAAGLTGYMWGTEYVRSTVRDCMETGKALILDEADNCSPAIFLKLCALLSSRTMSFPDGKRVTADDRFFVIACGNTTLTGASAQARGRSAQDQAIIDRFVMVEVSIDESLEMYCATHGAVDLPSDPVDITSGGSISPEDWTRRCQRARAAQAKLSMPCTISPRASILGADLAVAGIGRDWLDRCVLYRALTADQVSRLSSEIGG